MQEIVANHILKQSTILLGEAPDDLAHLEKCNDVAK
jgi:hypothetical protein